MNIHKIFHLYRIFLILGILLISSCGGPGDILGGAAGVDATEPPVAEVNETPFLSADPPTVEPSISADPIFEEKLTGAAQGNRPSTITYPSVLIIGHSTVITLEIILDPQNNGAGVIKVNTISPDGSQRLSIERTVPVYQVMKAELIAAGFDISSSDIENQRIVLADSSTLSWTWNVIATETNVQTVTINLYNVKFVDKQEFSNLSHSESFEILVQDKPFSVRVKDTLATGGWLTILGTAGPFGLIFAIITLVQTTRKENDLKKKFNELNDKFTSLEVKNALKLPNSNKPKKE